MKKGLCKLLVKDWHKIQKMIIIMALHFEIKFINYYFMSYTKPQNYLYL